MIPTLNDSCRPISKSTSETMFRKLVRNKKGIDSILATLLMVVIVVAASVMVFVYATGLFTALTQPPNLQREALSLEFSSFGPNNPTYNVTLYLRNTGSTPISLVSYYVKDSNSSQYAKATRTGPASDIFSMQLHQYRKRLHVLDRKLLHNNPVILSRQHVLILRSKIL